MTTDDIVADTAIELKLPIIIDSLDYHEFAYIQGLLEHVLQSNKIQVTELGFRAPHYVGLIHLNTPDHTILCDQLIDYYKQMSNE